MIKAFGDFPPGAVRMDFAEATPGRMTRTRPSAEATTVTDPHGVKNELTDRVFIRRRSIRRGGLAQRPPTGGWS